MLYHIADRPTRGATTVWNYLFRSYKKERIRVTGIRFYFVESDRDG